MSLLFAPIFLRRTHVNFIGFKPGFVKFLANSFTELAFVRTQNKFCWFLLGFLDIS
ncbi:hypothetical protein LEP1GSC072_0230 [Leptospira noguchii str. Bonito]|nr:hypothetical protein LEP1GSC072_0230 [Leptospira noguchii str. Bonito]